MWASEKMDGAREAGTVADRGQKREYGVEGNTTALLQPLEWLRTQVCATAWLQSKTSEAEKAGN